MKSYYFPNIQRNVQAILVTMLAVYTDVVLHGLSRSELNGKKGMG